MKTKLFETATFNTNDQTIKDEIERQLNLDVEPTKTKVTYKQRQIAVNRRNILVCEMVTHQVRSDGDFPYRGSWQEKTIKKLNVKYLRDNPYFNQKEQENWEVLLDKWEEKESQVKSKDMNDLGVLIDEKRKALAALYRHKRLNNVHKVESIQNHLEWLFERMQRVELNSVVTKQGSGKYYTKRSYTTGF